MSRGSEQPETADKCDFPTVVPAAARLGGPAVSPLGNVFHISYPRRALMPTVILIQPAEHRGTWSFCVSLGTEQVQRR